jgi:hypothetical protein
VVAKHIKTELVQLLPGFDYTTLEGKTADQARSAAKRIRDRVRRTIEDVIEIGRTLLTVKDALPHGQFRPWLLHEFGWAERTARNFMAVAEQFGSKSASIADLAITPTAAYLLAAPSTPFEARQAALDRAAAGETITATIAQEIVCATRKRPQQQGKPLPAHKLLLRLARVLGRFRDRWNPRDLPDLAHQLRGFADELDKGKPGTKQYERR